MLSYDLYYCGEFNVTVEDTDLGGVADRWLANFPDESFAITHKGGVLEFRQGSELVGRAVPSA